MENDIELSAWEVSKWIGVSMENLMELVHHGKVPYPVRCDPPLWLESDLVAWQRAGCPQKETKDATDEN